MTGLSTEISGTEVIDDPHQPLAALSAFIALSTARIWTPLPRSGWMAMGPA